MTSAEPQPMEFGPGGPLKGLVAVPGDKSISHRALMLAAMARGRSRIEHPSTGTDVAATAAALRQMGVRIASNHDDWLVDGVGTGCLLQPQEALDLANSATSARLLMGLFASHSVSATLIGDASLCRRPMDRVIAPLTRLGAQIAASPGGTLPLTVQGCTPAAPVRHRLTVASAQVKSALLLAGLNAAGVTEIAEPVPTRDHTERMLRSFGARLEVDALTGGGQCIRLAGEAELTPQHVLIPGDASSASFLIVATLVVPGSELELTGVGINVMRLGLINQLRRMGGDIRLVNERQLGNEPAADIIVRHSKLHSTDIPAEAIPAMIDEFPIFFIAAAFADGVSRTSGLSELRLKESDRLSLMCRGLRAAGVSVTERDDGLAVEGSAGRPLAGGVVIDPELDHRIAMSFAVAGLHSRSAITVADMTPVATSYTTFAQTLRELQTP